jgi:hypothetical protein
MKCIKCELGRILTLEQKEEIRLICMSGASFVLEFSPDSTDKYPICTCCGGNWEECPNCGRDCNQMCLLSEWDENKPRDCENCKGRNDMENLKPFLCVFIKYYYDALGNSRGGTLHIVLYDGNIDKDFISTCRIFAREEGDSFGIFLCDLLELFSEDELEELYDNNWGMKRNTL